MSEIITSVPVRTTKNPRRVYGFPSYEQAWDFAYTAALPVSVFVPAGSPVSAPTGLFEVEVVVYFASDVEPVDALADKHGGELVRLARG